MENSAEAIYSQPSVDSYSLSNIGHKTYSHEYNYMNHHSNSNDLTSGSKPNRSKPLFLSIQSNKASSKYIQPNLQSELNYNSIGSQGTNTREYFNDADNAIEIDQNRSEYSDMISSDSYDNDNGEQKFCNGYGEWGHVINRTERTILPDFKSHLFPSDIKNQADVIYNKMRYQVRRGKIRNQMLFFCVYNAHIELGRDVNPIQLGAQFGLSQGEVQRCDSLFSPLQTGYRPPSKNTSPLGYLPDYCQNMDLSQEAIDEIINMSANILRKDPTLYQENPQTVAAGLLRYFTVTNGVSTDDPQKITRVTNRSTVTIDGMFRRIATIDNS